MNAKLAFTAIAALSLALPSVASARAPKADPVTAAVADKTRSAIDRGMDEGRMPAAILAFAGFKPGQVVADWGAGGGYYSVLIADIVGPKGRVYAIQNPKYFMKDAWDAVVAKRGNIATLVAPAGSQALAPASLDAIFAHLEFHDLYLPAEKGGTTPGHDVAATLRNWFAALKPGGTVTIVDHVGLPGEPAIVAGTLHRIDPARVRADMEAAGFVFDASSDVLHRSEDDHTALVFDAAIRGKTDRFALRFHRN
jgi:predicted methyltransferase